MIDQMQALREVRIVPAMLHRIGARVVQRIREWGRLTPEEAGEAVGRSHDTIRRWENEKEGNLPRRELEEKLVEKVKLTREAFGEIMCRVLTEFVGRRFVMLPAGEWISSVPLFRARELFDREYHRLEPELRSMIGEMLDQARLLHAASEQTCRSYEKQIVYLIEQALANRKATTTGATDEE